MTTDERSNRDDEPTLEAVGGWPALISKASDGIDLTESEAYAAMATILDGGATPAQLAGLVIALRTKGESVVEMTGMVRAMRAAAEPLHAPDGAIDIVGTGGSAHRRSHALNVSTMASFVAVSAGSIVCKHGNYRASSTSGAFDFLAAIGVDVDIEPPALEAQMRDHGIGFALAKRFHPAMRHAGPVRSELGVPTVFNLLGPLANPGRVTRALVGTASEQRAEQMASVLQALGVERAWVVAGHEGLDELSTIGTNVAFDVSPSAIERIEISGADVGLTTPASMVALAGGDAEANRAIFTDLLAGRAASGPTDIVLLNAGAALVVSGAAADLGDGVDKARAALQDGRTAALVEALTS